MGDPLASALAIAQTGRPLLCACELVAPWGMGVDARTKIAVHVVERGRCWFRRAGETTALGPGDLVLVARGEPHQLADDPRTEATPYEATLQRMEQRMATVPEALRGATTRLLCAAYDFGRAGFDPVLDQLPRVVHLSAADVARFPQLQRVVQILAHEAEHHAEGRELVVPRMVDCLLVMIVRAWLRLHEQVPAGWLEETAHPGIARALVRIHEAPDAAWTVASLASIAGMSRPTFARHFARLVGEPPLAHVTRCRMSLAAKWLTRSKDPVSTIALRLGYGSGAAFGRAFRRYFDDSPAAYRGRAPG